MGCEGRRGAPLKFGVGEEPPLYPERYTDESNENGYLYEGTDDSGEGCPTVDTKTSDGHGDSEFEVIRCSRKREGCRLLIVCSDPLAHEEGYREHHNEVDQ